MTVLLWPPIIGGIGMGVGAAIAGGCTVGNAMVSTAQFEYQGWVSMVFMIVGRSAPSPSWKPRTR